MSTAPAAAWRRALWPGVAALAAVMGIGRFAFTPILPAMLASGALTLREAGWVASANFAGYLAGAMAASRIGARVAPRPLARAGLVATVLALAAMAVADGVVAWVAVRFAAGFASAVAMVFVSTLIFERLAALGETDRSMWMYAGVSAGIALSAPAVHAVEAAGGAWTTAWLVAAAAAAVFVVFAWPVGDGLQDVGARGAVGGRGEGGEGDEGGGVGGAGDRSDAAPRPPAGARGAFAATVLAYGLFGLGYVIHATYLPAMVRAAGYPPQAASWVWVLVGVAAMPAIAAWRHVARRFGPRTAIVGCYAVEGLTALAPLVAGDSLAAAVVAGAGLGATFIPATGLALTYVRSLDPARAARSIGLMTAAFGLGQIVGPVAAAHLADAFAADGHPFGPPSGLACAALLLAAAAMRGSPTSRAG